MLHRTVNGLDHWPYRKSGPLTACGLYKVAPDWHSPRPLDDEIAKANPLPKGDSHAVNLDNVPAWYKRELCPVCWPEHTPHDARESHSDKP